MTTTEGPNRNLRPDDFIQAAAAIVRAEGLHAFTMRHLADAMGLSTMAAYRYFPHKTDLFAAMIEKVWEAAIGTVEAQHDADPFEAIVRSLVGIRQRLVDQGELALLVAGPPAPTATLARLVEAGYERLRRAGFAESELADIQRIFGRMTAASAVHEAAASLTARLTGRTVRPADRSSAAEAATFERQVRLVLHGLLDERGLAPT